jgi:hypothetical protein
MAGTLVLEARLMVAGSALVPATALYGPVGYSFDINA